MNPLLELITDDDIEAVKSGNDSQKYYQYLKDNGADVPDSYESFSKTMQDENSAKKYYDYLKQNNFDTPDTYESFSSTLGIKKKNSISGSSQPLIFPQKNSSELAGSPYAPSDIATPIQIGNADEAYNKLQESNHKVSSLVKNTNERLEKNPEFLDLTNRDAYYNEFKKQGYSDLEIDAVKKQSEQKAKQLYQERGIEPPKQEQTTKDGFHPIWNKGIWDWMKEYGHTIPEGFKHAAETIKKSDESYLKGDYLTGAIQETEGIVSGFFTALKVIPTTAPAMVAWEAGIQGAEKVTPGDLVQTMLAPIKEDSTDTDRMRSLKALGNTAIQIGEFALLHKGFTSFKDKVEAKTELKKIAKKIETNTPLEKNDVKLLKEISDNVSQDNITAAATAAAKKNIETHSEQKIADPTFEDLQKKQNDLNQATQNLDLSPEAKQILESDAQKASEELNNHVEQKTAEQTRNAELEAHISDIDSKIENLKADAEKSENTTVKQSLQNSIAELEKSKQKLQGQKTWTTQDQERFDYLTQRTENGKKLSEEQQKEYETLKLRKDALQKSETESISLGETPGDSKKVERGVPESEKPADEGAPEEKAGIQQPESVQEKPIESRSGIKEPESTQIIPEGDKKEENLPKSDKSNIDKTKNVQNEPPIKTTPESEKGDNGRGVSKGSESGKGVAGNNGEKLSKEKKAEVVVKKISDIKTDEKRFQNRTELDEKKLKNIAENFDKNQLDPVVIWKDPKDGKDYLLAGHHRLKGSEMAGEKNIPARYFEGTEKEAITYAKDLSNANRTMEAEFDRAKRLKEIRESGDKKAEKQFLENEGKNKVYVENLSHLNPAGKVITMLKSLRNSGDKDTIRLTEKAADFIGDARRHYSELTDAHENELYDWLINKGALDKIKTKTEFSYRIGKVADAVRMNPEKPLNLEHRQTTGVLESEKLSEIKSVKTQIRELEKERDDTKKPVDAKRANEISNEIKKLSDRLGELNKELINAKAGDEQQTGLFDEVNEAITNNEITDEQADKNLQSTTPGELTSISENIESQTQTLGDKTENLAGKSEADFAELEEEANYVQAQINRLIESEDFSESLKDIYNQAFSIEYQKRKATPEGQKLIKDIIEQYGEKKPFTPEAKQQLAETAKRIRSRKSGGNQMFSTFDLGLYGLSQKVYNGALEFAARQVENGTPLGKAINKAIQWVDEQLKGAKWNKGLFAKHLNDQYKIKINGKEVEVRRDDTKKTAEVINGFYSPLEQRILDAKTDKTTGKEWSKVLNSDEAKWTGLSDFLEKNKDKSLSKEDIKKYLKDNRVQIVEVVKGDYSKETQDYFDELSRKNKYRDFADWDSQDQDDWMAKRGLPKDVKFESYQLPGEKENYKEVYMVLPREGSMGKVADWRVPSSHLTGDELVDNRQIVRLRMSVRKGFAENGKNVKVLIIDEHQGDRGQAGKKEGFGKGEAKDAKIIEDKVEGETKYFIENEDENFGVFNTRQEAEAKLKQLQSGIPSAPFVTETSAWVKLGLKVALKHAIEEGADRIAWTTGEQQNERYDLSKQIKSASAIKNNDGTYNLVIEDTQGNEIEPYSRSGKKVTPQEMEGIVGKDLTQKLTEGADRKKGLEWKKNMKINPEFHTVSGLDLKVGGKGMIGFYGSPELGKEGIGITEARNYKSLDDYLEAKLGKFPSVDRNDYRRMFPTTRGGWTKEKIRKFLKTISSDASETSYNREILKFNNPKELEDNLYYHGSGRGIGSLKPSITLSEREAETFGGGGYGERYWGISLSKDRNIASNFTAQSRSGSVAPVILKKGAKVIEMPEIQDAVEIEDHIEQLWNDGVDAVKIGKWDDGYSEQELVVLNPKAIVVGKSEGFQVYQKPKMPSFSNEVIANLHKDALDTYKKAHEQDIERSNRDFKAKYGRDKSDYGQPSKKTQEYENYVNERNRLTQVWEESQKPPKQNIGIVGNVAKALVKELTGEDGKIGETKIDTKENKGYELGEANYVDGIGVYDHRGDMVAEFDTKKEANDFIAKKSESTQHSIEITPELKKSVQQGMPLFGESKSAFDQAISALEKSRTYFEKNAKSSIPGLDTAWKAAHDVAIAHLEAAKSVVESAQAMKEAIEKAIEHFTNSDFYKKLTDERTKKDYLNDLKESLEEVKKEVKTFSTKNEATRERAKELGFSEELKEAAKSAKRDFEKVWSEADEAIESKKINPEKLREELANNPRAVSDLENAVLLNDQINLENEFDKVVSQINKGNLSEERLTQLQTEKQIIQNNLYDNFLASKNVGRETARGLNARKMLADKNFSLANMQNELRAQQDGKPLTPEQEKWVEEKYRDIREKAKIWDEFQKNYEAERQKLRKEIEEEIEKKYGAEKKTVVQKSKNLADKIRKAKIHRPGVFSSATPASLVWDGAVEIAAKTVEAGGSIAQGIADGIKHIKESEWYKSLTSDKQKEAEREYNKFISNPKVVSEESKLSAVKKRYQKMIADYKERRENEDYAKRERKPLKYDEEALKLKAELEGAKDEWIEGREKLRLEQRGWNEKGVDLFLKLFREGLLSRVTTLGKLASFGLTRQLLIRPLYNLAGQPFRIIPKLNQLAKHAPVEGGMNLAALAENYKTFVRKEAYKQAGKKLFGAGKSDIDRAYGDKQFNFGELPMLPTKSHGAIKHIPLQAEMNFAKKGLENWAKENGKDLSDPALKEWISKYSYAKGLDAIYLGESKLLKQWNMNIGMWEKQGGSKYALAKFAKFLFPIVKVPYNFSKDVLVHHSPVGLAKSMTEAFKADVNKLTPEQADKIVLKLKKGLVGSAMLGFGMYQAQKIFGGTYSQEDKKKNNILSPGDFVLGEAHIPHWATHNALLEAAQMGAAMANIFKDAPPEYGTPEQITKAIFMGYSSEFKNIPFYGELARDVEGFGNWSKLKKVTGNKVKSLIPGIIQETAEWFDTKEGFNPFAEPIKRKPKGFLEEIEMGVPGLRSSIQEKPEPKPANTKQHTNQRKKRTRVFHR